MQEERRSWANASSGVVICGSLMLLVLLAKGHVGNRVLLQQLVVRATWVSLPFSITIVLQPTKPQLHSASGPSASSGHWVSNPGISALRSDITSIFGQEVTALRHSFSVFETVSI